MAFDSTYPHGSDEWWLRMLHARLSARPEWQPTRVTESRRGLMPRDEWLSTLWAYRTGAPPLPRHHGADMRQDMRDFLRAGRANYAGLSVEQLLNVVTLLGVRSTESRDGSTDDALRRVMQESGPWFADAADYCFSMGESAVMVGGTKERPVITAEDPRNLVVVTDPLDRMHVTRALKVRVDEWTGATSAHLFVDEGPGEERVRVAVRDSGAGWSWDDSRSGPLPLRGMGLPIVPMPNKLGLGEFEPHLDVLDRINNGIADRLWIAKAQAFRQLALVADKDAEEIEGVDEHGTPIDLDEIFQLAPDSLLQIPKGWRLWEAAAVDLRQHLEAVDKDVREFSSTSGTPLTATMTDAVNQSAEGARAASETRDAKARDRIARLSPAVVRVARLVAAVAGMDDLMKAPLEPLWAPIGQESAVSRGQAALSAMTVGLPQEMVWSDILELTPDQVARARRLRDADALRALAQQQVADARAARQSPAVAAALTPAPVSDVGAGA